MTDVLIYWRDYRQNWVYQLVEERSFYWHTNARLFEEATPGDRLWFVTAGKNIAHVDMNAQQAGFLVGVWQVAKVTANPGDDPAYPQGNYRYRVVTDASASFLFDVPVHIDHIVRPVGRDSSIAIGRFLQGPRKLRDETVRELRSAAGPQMAKHYLTGRQA